MPNGPSDLELFRAIADSGSLTAAGGRLGLSPSVVSRRLKALEDRLNIKLVERTARRFHLTSEGELYRQRCDEILNAIHAAEEEVSNGARSAKGLLRIGAPMELGRRHVAPLVASFLSQHADVHAYLALSDMGWEVGSDRLDLALRVGRPDDPNVIARRIATTRRVLCAAPAYLARRGRPERPGDLADHDCLVLERRTHVWDRWGFQQDGACSTIQVSGSLSSASGDILHQWALQGLGLSCEAYWDVAEDLAEGRLVECLPGHACDEAELFATYLPDRHMPARLRLFLDYIAEAIRAVPTRRGD